MEKRPKQFKDDDSQQARTIRFAYEQLSNMNSVILRWDPRGNIIYLNEFGQYLFGFSEKEIIGKSVLGTIVPENESTGRNLRQMINDILKNPQKYEENENENITKDGRIIWMAWRNKPIFNKDGTLCEIFTVGLDISKRKKIEAALKASEQRYRSIFNNVTDTLIIYNKQGKIVEVNQAAEKMYGYNRKELIGRTPMDIISPEHQYKFKDDSGHSVLSCKAQSNVFTFFHKCQPGYKRKRNNIH